ncbi:MAG: peroxiredoxin [Pseudomonadota bacterium]
MAISVGDPLPESSFLVLGEGGPQSVSTADLVGDGKTVIFGLPGAYTGTCTTAHMPSFIRSKDALAAKGVTGILCVAVNDPFVLAAWDESTGAGAAGIKLLGDASGDFTRAVGMDFDAPPAGLFGRSKRYSMVVEGGTVTHINVEDNPGVCNISAGETLVDQL